MNLDKAFYQIHCGSFGSRFLIVQGIERASERYWQLYDKHNEYVSIARVFPGVDNPKPMFAGKVNVMTRPANW